MQSKVTIKFTEDEINERIEQLATEIMRDFKDQRVTLVCILKGGVMFMTHLAKKLNMEVEYDFMEISTYGNEKYSSGVITIKKEITNVVKDKNVIVVEDIIDTGNTIEFIKNYFEKQKPKSFKVATLVDKPCKRNENNKNIKADYTGFIVGDEFLVGYGLDDKQLCRNLSYIGVIE